MHFPNYPINRHLLLTRFWPETSSGGAFATNGRPLLQKETDKDGNAVMRPVPFSNSNPNHIRFASKRKCLQWLQKINNGFGIVHSENLLIHAN